MLTDSLALGMGSLRVDTEVKPCRDGGALADLESVSPQAEGSEGSDPFAVSCCSEVVLDPWAALTCVCQGCQATSCGAWRGPIATGSLLDVSPLCTSLLVHVTMYIITLGPRGERGP